MLQSQDLNHLHNVHGPYWCAQCWKFTLDCSHLADPLASPTRQLDYSQYRAVTWNRNILAGHDEYRGAVSVPEGTAPNRGRVRQGAGIGITARLSLCQSSWERCVTFGRKVRT